MKKWINYKKLLSILIITMLVFCQICIIPQQQAAEAFVPLAAELVPLAAKVLVAAGVSYATKEAAENMVDWWYGGAGVAVQQGLTDMYNSVVNGFANITDTVWTSARDFVSSNLIVGSHTATGSVPMDTTSIIKGVYTSYVAGTSFALYNAMTGLTTYQFRISTNANTYGTIHFTIYNSLEDYNAGIVGEEFNNTFTTNDEKKYDVEAKQVWTYTLSIPASVYFENPSFYASYWQILSYSGAVLIPYTGTDVISIPTWDYSNIYGERKVAVPTSTEDVLGLTYNDVVAEAPDVITKQTTSNSISLDWDAIPGSISYRVALDGVIVADAITATDFVIRDLAPATTYEISIAGLDAVGDVVKTADFTATTSTTAGTADLTIPTDGSLNFIPLINAVKDITNKFPFSLPWDLARSFGVLNGTAAKPNFDLSIPIWGKTYQIPVNISMFDPLVTPVRAILLLAFDVGMIFATRRLFGGAE